MEKTSTWNISTVDIILSRTGTYIYKQDFHVAQRLHLPLQIDFSTSFSSSSSSSAGATREHADADLDFDFRFAVRRRLDCIGGKVSMNEDDATFSEDTEMRSNGERFRWLRLPTEVRFSAEELWRWRP